VRIATGDDFEAFWTAHRPSLARAIAATLGDAQLAGEAVDEAMARALQHWGRVRAMDHPTAWVFRVGVNWGRTRQRRVARSETAASGVDSVVASESRNACDSVAMPEPSIGRALAALPHGQRAVVVCRLLLGWSERQTAVALRIPAGTVKSRLARALDSLSVSLAHLDPRRSEDDTFA